MTFLKTLAQAIDRWSERVGRAVAWLALAMVLIQFAVVVLRYVFGVGSIVMQESVVYAHAVLFLVGSAYTLLHEGHVRVDVFYRTASNHRKALVDFLGAIAFLIPVCILITIYSWGYVINSWQVMEGSKETSGIPGVFLLKTAIVVFTVMMALQGLSMAARCFLRIAGADADAVASRPSE